MPQPHRILSISYDETLLHTRQLLLETRGYQVTSSLGFTDSLEHCKRAAWELMILGHSIPEPDKRALMTQIRRNCNAPVLALHRYSELPLEGADYALTPDSPEDLLEMVDSIFAARKGASG